MPTSEDESWINAFASAERDEGRALAEPGYAGVVGENAIFEVTLRRVIKLATQWGPTYVYRFEDEFGRQIFWKTRTSPKRALGAIDEEDTFLVHGTVQEHCSHRGAPETRIARCWLQALDEDSADAAGAQEVA